MNSIRCILFILIVFQVSCKGYQKKLYTDDAEYKINVDSLENKGVGLISSYFKSVKPIILETSENNLLRSIDAIQATNDCIFILDRGYKKLYCFNKVGKFIGHIGNLGDGPGEFSNISDFTIDENNKLKSEATMSDLAMANVEALAQNDSSDCANECYDNGDGCFGYT